jgi:G2/mitotic-specific cyclin-B, other
MQLTDHPIPALSSPPPRPPAPPRPRPTPHRPQVAKTAR